MTLPYVAPLQQITSTGWNDVIDEVNNLALSIVVHPSGDTTGVTDRAAINAALVAGSPTLGPGTFYTNGTISLAASGRRLRGSGRDVTTIYLASGSNPADGVIGYGVGNLSNVTISDLTVDGNKAGNSTGDAVRLPVFSDTTVERCRFKNTADRGVFTYLGSNVSVLDCDLVSIGSINTIDGTNAAIICQGTLGTRVIGNRVDGCTDSGILTMGDGANLVVGNHVEDCYYVGIGLGGSHTAAGGPHLIQGNTVDGVTASNSIDTGDACNVTVAGNTLMNTPFSAICHDPTASGQSPLVANLTIVGNTIYDTANTAILIIGGNAVTAHSGFTINGNSISATAQHGIGIAGFRHGTVVGNTIHTIGSAWSGIRLDGATGPVTDLTITGNTVIDPTAVGVGVSTSGASNDWILVTANNLRTTATKLSGAFGANSITTGNMV